MWGISFGAISEILMFIGYFWRNNSIFNEVIEVIFAIAFSLEFMITTLYWGFYYDYNRYYDYSNYLTHFSTWVAHALPFGLLLIDYLLGNYIMNWVYSIPVLMIFGLYSGYNYFA